MKIRPKFKHDKDILDVLMGSPILASALFAMLAYCENRDLDFTVTSYLRSKAENSAVGAVSQTHVDGRAFDLRTRDWAQDEIEDFVEYWNTHYYFSQFGALNKKGKRNLAIYHSGTANHLHIQVDRKHK